MFYFVWPFEFCQIIFSNGYSHVKPVEKHEGYIWLLSKLTAHQVEKAYI